MNIATFWEEIIRVLRLLPWTLRLLWHSHRGATVGVILLTFVQAIVPIAQLWIAKLLVDQIVMVLALPEGSRVGEPINQVFLIVTVEAVLLLGGVLVGLLSAHIRNILQEHLVYHVQLKVLAQSALLDLEMYESPDYYDQMHRAQQQAVRGPIELLGAILALTETTFSLVSICVIIALYQPWVILLLTLTGIPSFWVMMHYGRQRFLLLHGRTPDGRRAAYLGEVLSSNEYAKEVRVWSLSNYLIKQIEVLRSQFKEENIDLSRRQSIATFFGELLSTLGYYGAYLGVVIAVIAGRLTLGDLIFYAGLFSRSQALFESMLHSIATVYEIQLFAEQLEIFLALAPSVGIPEVPTPVPELQKGIVVENLSFTYPGTDRTILKDVNFTINPGECVALVGVNGAGKTTLVKCLLRLYEVNGGAIWADGINLHELDPLAWRQQISVVFQDYARYQLTAQENIGFGNLDLLHDLERIRSVAQEASIDTVLQQLPEGYQSILGRTFAGGHELSLGQWQRVALARALLREVPFLILDEPTAAMDAQAEYELYQKFSELAQNRMTLLISHRFSTVRMADKILVLENGSIIEEGNHEELLQKNGRYAHLFNLQAESYQTNLPPRHSNGHQRLQPNPID